MPGKFWTAVAACAVCAFAAGCGQSQPESDAAPPRALAGSDWTLVTLDGEPVAPLSDGRRPTLGFEADRVYGFAGCNRLNGGYRTEGREIGFTQIAMTRMACAEGMDIEQRFSRALERVSGYEMEDDRLVLEGDDGRPVAVLETGS